MYKLCVERFGQTSREFYAITGPNDASTLANPRQGILTDTILYGLVRFHNIILYLGLFSQRPRWPSKGLREHWVGHLTSARYIMVL